MRAVVPDSSKETAGSRRGGTLVEVMIGIVILGILAVTGAMYLAESRGTLAVQRNKTSALCVAGGRLEQLSATRFSVLTNKVSADPAIRYLRWAGTNWMVSGSDPGETVVISGVTKPMRTTVWYVDMFDDGMVSYDALRARAEVNYRADNWVVVETLLGP